MAKPDVTEKKVQRIYRLPMVLDATGWSRSTLYTKINEGKFPAPIKLDPDGRAVGWPEDDVLTHQEALLATRSATEAA